MELKKTIETLLTDQWLVELTDEERIVYMMMREAEDGFIENCKKLGCIVLSGTRRQSLVLVPPGIALPSMDNGVYANWANILQTAALEQGKKLTIGARSSQPPLWFERGHWVSQRPGVQATRVTWRKNSAARGAQITADEALDYLRSRVATLTNAVANSIRAGQKTRAEDQRERLEAAQGHLRDAIGAIEMARIEQRKVSAQILSGTAWKLHAKFDDGSAHTFSVPSIGLLGVIDEVQVTEATPRKREVDGEVLDFGLLRFRLI